MQRISKQAKGSGSLCKGCDLPLSLRVSDRLTRKIRCVSAETRLPDPVVAGELIMRGFDLLKMHS
jgi:hypothetical protein